MNVLALFDKLLYYITIKEKGDKKMLIRSVSLLEGTPAGNQAGSWEYTVMMLLVLGLMLFLFWFMGRKQRKQQKIMAERRNNLKNGDKVMMTCGIYGTVTEVGDTAVTIVTGGTDGIPLVFNKQYIAVVEYDDDVEDLSKKEAENANK